MSVYIQVFMLAVIFTLSAYAILLCKKLWKLKRDATTDKNKEQQRVENKKIETQESIHILISCLLQDQVSLTEAAIRISGLAKSLKLSDIEQQFYIAFDNLAMATSHIPILEAWGKLSTKEQKRFNDERGTIEGEHKDKVLDAAKRLRQPQ
ncbi:MAG: DUF2489 domain-containing protein [Cellvibrionales bacterium]|jgi:hypothetical protein|nr:DUF2489 domain-containing protein [Cellvibrionales bacterium]